MVGIFIDHDLIAVPEPVTAQGKVKGGDAESEAAKPETAGAASTDAPDVAAAEAAGEAAVLPGMIEVEAGVIASGVVSDPSAVVVDVRSFRMAFPVAIRLGCGPGGRAASRGWTVVRNVSATNGMTTASAVASMLRERG
jgi:hypothetical protein